MCVCGEDEKRKKGNSRECYFCFRLVKWGSKREKNYELQGTYRPIKFTNLDVNVTDGAENV